MAAKKKAKKRTVRNVNWFCDEHYKLKMQRDAINKKLKAKKREIEKLEAEAITKFGKEGLEGAKGAKATGFIQELDHYGVDDRSTLDKYVKRTGNFELFQNRISSAAVEEIQATNKRFSLKGAGISLYTSIHFRTRKR